MLGGKLIIDIPPIKARPETIFKLLQIVKLREGNYKLMSQEIYNYLTLISIRKKQPTVKNLVRAVALPTLRHLKLIEGNGDDTHLTARGSILLNKSKDVSESIVEYKFRKAFAQYILGLEERYFIPVIKNAMELINNKRSNIFHIFELKNKIHKEYKGEGTTLNRLKRWLIYLKYVGFVKEDGKPGMYRLIVHQIWSAEIDEPLPSKKEFKVRLVENYKKLAKFSTRLGYVSIPSLRDAVCISFKGRLWDEDFYQLMGKITMEDEHYVISFAEPMMRKAGGIRINGIYYYYIYIRDRDEQK